MIQTMNLYMQANLYQRQRKWKEDTGQIYHTKNLIRELKITKYNESYIKCTSKDLGLLQELSEFFTFKVPGASFMPSVRAKRWDGQIRLFSKATGKLYYGLRP